MNNKELMMENAMLREIIQEQNAEIEFLESKLYNIELYIKECERKSKR